MSDEVVENTIPADQSYTPAVAPVREGLALAPAKGEEDSGICSVYPGLPKEQFVRFRTVLTDGVLDDATEAANAGGKYSNAKFRATLIRAMILESNVKNRAVDPTSGANPYFDLKDDATLARLPSAFTVWLTNEIQRCDGSIANVSKTTIAGREVDFRSPA